MICRRIAKIFKKYGKSCRKKRKAAATLSNDGRRFRSGRPDYNFLKVHYMLTPYPPLLVRRDLAGGAGMQPAGSKGVLPAGRAEFRVKE